MEYEKINNVAQALVFRKSIPAGEKGFVESPIVEHGFVRRVRIRFAPGEAGTLHIRPVIILPGNIMIDLFQYAVGGDKYISGDDETSINDVKVEVENHTMARVYYENTGVDGSANSQLNVDIEVEYSSVVIPKNIIG